MASTHHFTVFATKGLSPNGWKVLMILEELGLNYKVINLDFNKNEQKGEEHTTHNPNGRVPTVVDHRNNDFAVWETGAIITYLVEKYDTTHKISFEKFEDKVQQRQWLFFQASGQGPYFGQAGWFMYFTSDKQPTVIERYQKEIFRVLGMLDSVLAKRSWLVGDKCSAADLSFFT